MSQGFSHPHPTPLPSRERELHVKILPAFVLVNLGIAGFRNSRINFPVQSAIIHSACRHSGVSRNPGKNWMPDQVRHDPPVSINVAIYRFSLIPAQEHGNEIRIKDDCLNQFRMSDSEAIKPNPARK
jgi:hypothetical protein